MSGIGKTAWVIPGGRIPIEGTGHEPEFTSRDELWFLNTGDEEAHLRMTFFYGDRDPIGPYPLTVAAARVRCARVNDLILPQAVPLDAPYGVVIESNRPVVVQVARYDTRQAELGMSWSLAFPVE